MSGTSAGAAKAVVTIKNKYGNLYFEAIGRIGGATPTTKPKGFAANRELARTAGAKGGAISRRGASKPKLVEDFGFTPKSRVPLLKRLLHLS